MRFGGDRSSDVCSSDLMIRRPPRDRKSTRLNSSHLRISYAVFCLKKEEHTSELQSPQSLGSRLLLDKKTHTSCHVYIYVMLRGPSTSPLFSYSPLFCFFFNDTATTEIYTLSLHDALPISSSSPAITRSRQRTARVSFCPS